jgi:hypothetical protein
MSVTDSKVPPPFAERAGRVVAPVRARPLVRFAVELPPRLAERPLDERPVERPFEERVLARGRGVLDEALARDDVFP